MILFISLLSASFVMAGCSLNSQNNCSGIINTVNSTLINGCGSSSSCHSQCSTSSSSYSSSSKTSSSISSSSSASSITGSSSSTGLAYVTINLGSSSNSVSRGSYGSSITITSYEITNASVYLCINSPANSCLQSFNWKNGDPLTYIFNVAEPSNMTYYIMEISSDTGNNVYTNSSSGFQLSTGVNEIVDLTLGGNITVNL